jgi:two-component system response regulator FixJ
MADVDRSGVAIIDDDPAVLDSLKLLLDVAGHTAGAYGSAAAFLEDRVARPACLILDQHMPVMTGLELATRLREECVGIPVLLMTGQVSPTIIERARKIGITKVLEKPLAEDDLLNFVHAHT